MNVLDSLDLIALLTPVETAPEVKPAHPENSHAVAPIPDKAFRNMPDGIAAGLVAYVHALQGRANAYFARLPRIPGDQITVDASGRKYLRIVQNNASSRSVVCFVEKKTGLIWKADGWATPAKNFPRGNVCDLAGIHQEGWAQYHY